MDEMDLANFLARLSWKHGTPNLSLLSSYNYRHEAQVPPNKSTHFKWPQMYYWWEYNTTNTEHSMEAPQKTTKRATI
jgi:hypothetical protein